MCTEDKFNQALNTQFSCDLLTSREMKNINNLFVKKSQRYTKFYLIFV